MFHGVEVTNSGVWYAMAIIFAVVIGLGVAITIEKSRERQLVYTGCSVPLKHFLNFHNECPAMHCQSAAKTCNQIINNQRKSKHK